MIRILTFLIFCFGITAQANPLTTLLTADDAEAWRAVGRLNLGPNSMCTGALISPTEVLTAAHCFFEEGSNTQIDAGEVTFLAGWRNGRAVAIGNASRVVIHKDYSPTLPLKEAVRVDLALVQLIRPIDRGAATPFELEKQPRVGNELTVVSYARNRAEAPSLETGCKVLDQSARVITANCDVDFGASGSPIFVIENGVPKIASVVSAMAQTDSHGKFSIGVALGDPLIELREQLSLDNNVFQRKKPGLGSIAEQLGRE